MTERPLHFAAFVMDTASHLIQGAWRRPTARQADFNSLDLWVDLAKTLERGGFDAIFFADVVGLYAPYRGDERKYVEVGLQVPSNDPSVLASAIAYASPSPQRTPLLFQAGASEAGRTFAAKNAEAVFIVAPTVEAAARDTADIRARERGLARREYAEGTLRQKLFGQGDRLPDSHPAARYRGAFARSAA